jgi:hypothetical protein
MIEIVMLMVTVGAETSWAIEFASPGSLCYSNEVRSSSGASRWPRAKAWIIKGLPDPRSGTLSDLESEGSGKLVRRVLRRAHAVQR